MKTAFPPATLKKSGKEVISVTKRTLTILSLVGLSLILTACYHTPKPSPTTGETNNQPTVTQPVASPITQANTEAAAVQTVNYTESGFSPASITVKVGTIVTWVNQSSTQMWVASAVHPTHQVLPGFDQLQGVGKGKSYSYAFTKTGEWKYHNHLAPSNTGVIIVE